MPRDINHWATVTYKKFMLAYGELSTFPRLAHEDMVRLAILAVQAWLADEGRDR